MELRYLSEEFFKTSMNRAKKYCYITDKKKNSGLDFEKSIPIITNSWLKENVYPVINEYEFNYIKFDESKIIYQFTVFLNAFKKNITRRKKNPNIPENKDFQFCTLKYFLKELGL